MLCNDGFSVGKSKSSINSAEKACMPNTELQLPPPPKDDGRHAFTRLSVGEQDISKSCGEVGCVTRMNQFDFGEDQNLGILFPSDFSPT